VCSSDLHNRIAFNGATKLLGHLGSRPCQIFINDVKLRVASLGDYYYPDVMVTCTQQAANESQVVEDPILVVEVLSPSTENIDRREKLHAYRRIPTLQEYALIAQDRQQVEVYRRQGDIGWLYITFEPGDTVEFASVGLSLPIADLYAGTDVTQ
jgi:Uma2 family endonuclease